MTLIFIYQIIKQGNLLKGYTDELAGVITEAENIRKDLIQLMDDALGLSQTLVDDLDARLAAQSAITPVSPEYPDTPALTEQPPSKVIKFNPCNSARIRVYDLARELDLPSRELIAILQNSGIKVTSHMNLVDAGQSRALVQEFIQGADYSNMPSDQGTVVITDAPGAEPEFMASLQSAHPYLAVRSLYEKGYPVWQIAKILGRGQGEINLILNLSRKKQIM